MLWRFYLLGVANDWAMHLLSSNITRQLNRPHAQTKRNEMISWLDSTPNLRFITSLVFCWGPLLVLHGSTFVCSGNVVSPESHTN